MFEHLLVGLKVKLKREHKYLGLTKGRIGIITEVESNPKIAPNVYVQFKMKNKKTINIGFMVYEVERVI